MEGKKRVVPREVCTERSEKSNRYRKVTLNVQKSAEATVAGSFFFFFFREAFLGEAV